MSTFYGLGIRRTRNDHVLDVYFPSIHAADALPAELSALHGTFTPVTDLSDTQKTAVTDSYSDHLLTLDPSTPDAYSKSDVGLFCLNTLQDPVNSVEAAYFKLQLLSQRLVKPHGLSLDGLFGTLLTLAWTNKGPLLLDDVDRERIKAHTSGTPLTVSHVDKFPYLVNYHIPSGTRIAAGSQVRLGAYLSEGTTIMPAGYVNFNAGTEGQAMIEGRVSAGVVVGDKSDIGGGASIMGTLSGGNEDVISIGQSCLLGANAGTGISLGDGCTIAAGLYIYAGMKISLYNAQHAPIDANGNPCTAGENVVKAKTLSGRNNMLFIADSQSGEVRCLPNTKQIKLNDSLHQND